MPRSEFAFLDGALDIFCDALNPIEMVPFFERQEAQDLAFAVYDQGAHPILPEPDRLANLELVV